MEALHAPLRIQYILSPNLAPKKGLFTRIGQSNHDEANLVIARERSCYALLNSYPYTGGHLMVVPYKEVPDLNGLTEDEILGLMKLTRDCQNALAKVMKPDGFNIGINLGKVAGAGKCPPHHVPASEESPCSCAPAPAARPPRSKRT